MNNVYFLGNTKPQNSYTNSKLRDHITAKRDKVEFKEIQNQYMEFSDERVPSVG